MQDKNKKPSWSGAPRTINSKDATFNIAKTFNREIVLVMQNLRKSKGDVTVTIKSGSMTVVELLLPSNSTGLPVLFSHNYNGKNMEIKIDSESKEGVEFKLVAIGPGMYPTKMIPKDSKEHLFEPIFKVKDPCKNSAAVLSTATPARETKVRFGQRLGESSCYVLFNGDSPEFYATNTNSLPPTITGATPYTKFTSENFFVLKNNFWGNTLTIANVSPRIGNESFFSVQR